MKIVKVTWIDAQRLEHSIWDEKEVEEINPIECDIVGFLTFSPRSPYPQSY